MGRTATLENTTKNHNKIYMKDKHYDALSQSIDKAFEQLKMEPNYNLKFFIISNMMDRTADDQEENW